MVAFWEPIIEYYLINTSMFAGAYYAIESFLFLLDSLAYFVGYMVFVRELKMAISSGYIDKKYTGALKNHEHTGHVTDTHGAGATAVSKMAASTLKSSSLDRDDSGGGFEDESKVSLLELTKRIGEYRKGVSSKVPVVVRNGSYEKLSCFDSDVHSPVFPSMRKKTPLLNRKMDNRYDNMKLW